MKISSPIFLIIVYTFLLSIFSCEPSKEKKIQYLRSFNRIMECGVNDQQNCLVFATLINEDTLRTMESGYTHNHARLLQWKEIGIKDIEISKQEIKKLKDHDKHIQIKSVAENIIINMQHFYDTLLSNAITEWEKGNKDQDLINILQISLDQNIRECKILYERMVEYSTKNKLEKSSWKNFTPCKQPEI